MVVAAAEVAAHRPKRWALRERPPAALHLALPDVHPLKTWLLYHRGYTEPGLIRQYHTAGFADLHDPLLMPAMATATARLQTAVEKGEMVTIYGDYDADGVTGSAILQRALAAVHANVNSYIPKRLEDGYGLHAAAIERLAAAGSRVMITVDCGITSTAEIALAASLGVDVIVCDHHKLPAQLPPALALLHPELGGYPFGHLCAAGVSFKLAQALLAALPGTGLQPEELTDLAAVGTLADMVPLVGENRVLVRHGLDKLRRDPNLGLSTMIDMAGIDRDRLTCSDVSFSLAPHINASGRLDDAGLAYELLVGQNEARAMELAGKLQTLNEERQRLTREVLEQARELAANCPPEQLAYALGGEGWPPGVVGLVAGKLVEETGKPAFIAELGADICRGSARGVAGFDLVEALRACDGLLLKYGGHPRAAGFTLKREAFDAFAQAIIEVANATLSQQQLEPVLSIDTELKTRHLTWDIYNVIQEVGPFGVGNPTPTFLLRGLRPLDARGTARDHLRLKFRAANGQMIDGFGFGLGARAGWIAAQPEVDVAFELTSSRFHGYQSIELRVRDVRPSTAGQPAGVIAIEGD